MRHEDYPHPFLAGIKRHPLHAGLFTVSEILDFEERAAVLEYDGGHDRETAERMALANVEEERMMMDLLKAGRLPVNAKAEQEGRR
jgi:hypothetical protein